MLSLNVLMQWRAHVYNKCLPSAWGIEIQIFVRGVDTQTAISDPASISEIEKEFSGPGMKVTPRLVSDRARRCGGSVTPWPLAL